MMQWTTDKPTTPGWYWWRKRKGFIPAFLDVTSDHIKGTGFFIVGAYTVRLAAIEGEWSSGPIPEPTERDERGI